MRPARLAHLVGVFAVVAVLSGLATVSAHAGVSSCIQACVDQWQADRAACRDALDARLAAIESELEACQSACNPSDIRCQAKCVRRANIQRRSAENEFRRCTNRAHVRAWNCYRDCQQSQARP